MATETVASAPIPATDDDEQVEKKVCEEKKSTGEEDSVSLTKENGEEIIKTEELASLETPPKSEAVDHENIEPPVVAAEKIVDAPASDFPLVDEIKVGNGTSPEILDRVVEAEKNADTAVSDVPLVEGSKVESNPIPDIPEQAIDAVKTTEEVESSTESLVGEAPKEPAIVIIEEGKAEQPKIVDAPQSLSEAVETPEEPVETVLTEIKESEPESVEVQKPEVATAEVEEKPREPCEVSQEPERKLEEVDLEKSVQDENVKDVGSPADKVELISFLEKGIPEAENKPSLEGDEAPKQTIVKEEKTHVEVGPEKSLEDDMVKDEESSAVNLEASTILEGQTDKEYEASQVESPEEVLLNKDGADYSVPDASELVASEEPKEEVTEVNVVEKLPEEAAVEIKKVGGEVLETEETEKETVVTEYSTEPMKEEEKAELNGIEEVEKLAEESSVKLGTVGEGNVESLEIEEKEKSDVVIEEPTQPIDLDQKKDLSGLDVVENLTKEAAADEIEKVREENAETEGRIQIILEDEKKDSSGADVIEKLAEEKLVKLEDVGEENVGKIAETKECERKDEIVEDSSQPIVADQKKASSEVDVVEKLAEEARVELIKIGEDDETNNVQSEDIDGKHVVDEVLTQKDIADEGSYIITPSEVLEKSYEGAGKNVEPVAENIKDETAAAVETKKDDNVEQKQDEVTTLVSEPDGDSKPFEPEVKSDEPVTPEKTIEEVAICDPATVNEEAEHIKDETPCTVETKKEDDVSEKQDEVTTLVTEPLGESKPSEPEVKCDEPVILEKAIGDVAQSDRNIELPSKDGIETKPSSEDLPKEVSAKPSHKQSNTILSKVKHTLVKAKRVITGKSPSSKTPASETKDDIKVK